ncbi:leucine-rich repeat protein [Polaribacter sp. Asnod6-C07]|uniref:leucine-rich repeat protein n=1 Tax=Polaribacter sp. Asnod6-C07 TaxID=3160582 RepID=UPI0038705FEB
MKTKLILFLVTFVAMVANAQQTVGTIFTVGGFKYQITVAGSANASSVREVAVIDYLDVNNFTPTIPSTVFYGTTYNVTSIGVEAFRSNSLTSVSIPNSIISIGEDAFLFNSLTSVSIPNSVTSIGQSAFSYNPLTNITIPASVTAIGAYAFNYNSSLVSVISESTNPAFLLSGVFDNNNSIDLTIPTGLEQTYLDANWVGFNTINSIDYTFTQNDIVYQILDITNNDIVATYDYIGTNTTISIPATVTNSGSTYNVTTIGDASFDYNSLTEVTIPASVTTIRAAAFKNNSLTSITIPATVTTIGASAFENNYYLTDVTSESTTPATLLSFTFSNNNIDTDLTIPENTTTAYTTAGWVGFKSVTEVASLCTVNIPDANFKAYLVGNSLINTNGDTEIQCSEATAFTGSIVAISLNISDLTGIEAFTALTSIDCRDNQLTSINLPSSTALTELKCGENQITSLDVSANTALTNLSCHTNQLMSLDVSSNTALTELDFDTNPMTSIDVSANTALVRLAISRTQLTSIDVSTNTALEDFFATDCQLTSLDVSAQPNLVLLWCNENQLTSLNIANGNNANMTSFYATNNTALTCIEVDAAIVGTSPTDWYKDATATYSASCTTCTVNIPDTKFKTYLVGNAAINTNGDTEIQCSEASAFTGTIDVSSLTINYLTGIEAFINITELNCNYNNYISSIDISANTALTSLACNGNVITSLDVSNNTALKYLDCANNLIPSLDVSANTALTTLACNGNLLTSLDVSQNTLLINLWCHINQLTSLDVTNNINLEFLTLYINQLTSLDVTNNINLEFLTLYINQLTSLDVSNNTVLEQLHCSNNQLTSLDVSNNRALTRLSCAINQLTSLNVANGNNSNIVTASFYAGTNPNLTCVTVDDVAYSDANWTNIDAQTSFSTNCGALSVDDFSLNTVSIYPNPTTSVLNIKMDSNLKRATIYSVLGIKILETSSKNITTSNLKRGIYLIKIEDEDGSISSKRFMKE